MPLGDAVLPIKLTYLSSDAEFSHHPPSFQQQQKTPSPDVTDVAYSMFYLGYLGVFIGSYSQMKSNGNDKAGVKAGGRLKGFLKCDKEDVEIRVFKMQAKTGHLSPLTMAAGCSEYLRSSHTLFSQRFPGNQQGAACPATANKHHVPADSFERIWPSQRN